MASIRRYGFGVCALVASSALVLTGCSNPSDSSSQSSASSPSSAAEATSSQAAADGVIKVEDNFGTQEIKLPVERVASTDNRTFAVLADWGVDLVAVPKQLVSPEITTYRDNDEILDLGMHFEPNLENMVAAAPDLIINGQRFAKQREEIKKLNPDTPMIEFEPREGKDFGEELKREVSELGKILGKEKEADKMIADFDAALKRAKEAYDGEKKVMAVIVSGGKIVYVTPSKGRTFGPLYDMLGLKPALEVEGATGGAHGDDISVEAIAESNPDIMLVMDRDAPIKASKKPEYVPAKEAIEKSEALANVPAVKNGAVYYSPKDTYLNESLPLYTEMLNSLADMFEAQK